jgi:hypothetical protein
VLRGRDGEGDRHDQDRDRYVFGLPKDCAKNVHVALLTFWLPEV